jgi:F-type H+-transporting ATPase subunit b
MHSLDESFIIAICFVIFIYLAYRPVKKAIVSSLDKKIDEIKSKLTETENIKKEAKLLLEEIKQEMEHFEEQKKSILNSADISTKRLIELRTKEMELLLSKKKDSVIKSINNKKNKASEQMRIELTNAVLKTVTSYLTETKNNSVSDQKIISNLLNK